MVVEEASGTSLTVRQPGVDGGVFSVALKMLDHSELAGLATALTVSDHCLAAFFLLADGQDEAARRHLPHAGAEGGTAEFTDPVPARGPVK